MKQTKEPEIRIPTSSRGHRRLVAIREDEYRQYRQMLKERAIELAEILEAEADVRAGRTIRAQSIDEALKIADARGWTN